MESFLARITPVILCYNEEANIRKNLEKLVWAKAVVVVDSFSTDDTLQIASEFENIHIYKRNFDTHATQWNYALDKVNTEWVMTLDADYVLTNELIREISQICYPSLFSAYTVSLRMCVLGKPIRCGLMPPRMVLFDKKRCIYYDDGHTQQLKVDGLVSSLRGEIYHDDLKPLDRFLWSQTRYSLLTLQNLTSRNNKEGVLTKGGLAKSMRIRSILWPFLMFCYILFWKGGIFEGSRGVHYAFQRLVAESIIKLRLLEKEIKNNEH